jgi:hypothetical protein
VPADVEAVPAGCRVVPVLVEGQQIGQCRRESAPVQLAGDVAIARAVPPASAAVGEHDQSPGAIRHREIGLQRHARGEYLDGLLHLAHFSYWVTTTIGTVYARRVDNVRTMPRSDQPSFDIRVIRLAIRYVRVWRCTRGRCPS